MEIKYRSPRFSSCTLSCFLSSQCTQTGGSPHHFFKPVQVGMPKEHSPSWDLGEGHGLTPLPASLLRVPQACSRGMGPGDPAAAPRQRGPQEELAQPLS